MGADMHMYLEYRVGGKCAEWIADENHKPEDIGLIAALNTPRNYAIFSALACVRGGGGELPRGTPDDISSTVKTALDSWGIDSHSHSWLSIEEFERILNKKCARSIERTDSTDAFNHYVEYETSGSAYVAIVNYCKKLREKLSVDGILLGNKTLKKVDIRLVFWFDN